MLFSFCCQYINLSILLCTAWFLYIAMSFTGKKVSNEISRIMGPTSSNLRYNLSSRSLTSSHGPIQIARKPKRKSKLRIAEELHGVPKRRLSTAYFRKKKLLFLTLWDPILQYHSVAVKRIFV